MPIKFPCPHCKQSLSIRDELAGKTGRCPRCQQTITVPAAGATVPAAAPAPAKFPASPPLAAPSKAPAPRPAAGQPAGAARAAPAKKAGPPPIPPPVPPKSAPRESTPPPSETTAPAPAPEDVEAEAAALFSDKPADEPQAEPTTVDFTCPYCDTELHLSADLAGKKAPCPNPECRRIIKVPELVKKDPKDWRQARTTGPSMAKVDAGPAPEGTWDSTTRAMVGGQALVEAGVVVKRQKPRTLVQKLLRPVLYGTLVVLLGGGGWAWYSWWVHNREARALAEAEKAGGSDDWLQKARPAGRAALFTRAGEYQRRVGKPGCGTQARDRYGKALAALGQGSADGERDAALAELALAVLEIGGSPDEVQNDLRISWDETQKMLRAILSLMREPGRFDTLRAVSRGLMVRGQADRVLPLAGQVFPSPEADKLKAVAIVGLEFLAAGDTDRATQAAEQALGPFSAKPPKDRPDGKPEARTTSVPAASPAVIALALATKKDAPKTTGPEADADQLIGESEGLARQGQVEQALQMVKKPRFSTQVHFRAFVGVAAAAVEAKSPEAGSVVGEALTYLEGKKRIPSDLSWEIRRLMELGQRAGVAEDRLKTMAGLIPDPALRGRAELGLFRAQLDRGKDAVEEGAAEQVVPNGSVAQLLAFEAVARHNTRRDPDWAKAVAGWEEPRKAFGFLGVALGLQDRGKGH